MGQQRLLVKAKQKRGEMSVKCSECGREFEQKEMAVLYKVHRTNEYRYVCRECTDRITEEIKQEAEKENANAQNR